MTPVEVALIVRYQAYPGQGDQVAALLARHTAATRAEPGCRDFVALRGAADPDSFILYERYESREAFEAHVASPHYEGIAVAQIRPLLSERIVEFCQVIAAGETG
ncbi:MAG: putative quinol monooxygenase [Streptosporangiaceae bacterium]